MNFLAAASTDSSWREDDIDDLQYVYSLDSAASISPRTNVLLKETLNKKGQQDDDNGLSPVHQRPRPQLENRSFKSPHILSHERDSQVGSVKASSMILNSSSSPRPRILTDVQNTTPTRMSAIPMSPRGSPSIRDCVQTSRIHSPSPRNRSSSYSPKAKYEQARRSPSPLCERRPPTTPDRQTANNSKITTKGFKDAYSAARNRSQSPKAIPSSSPKVFFPPDDENENDENQIPDSTLNHTTAHSPTDKLLHGYQQTHYPSRHQIPSNTPVRSQQDPPHRPYKSSPVRERAPIAVDQDVILSRHRLSRLLDKADQLLMESPTKTFSPTSHSRISYSSSDDTYSDHMTVRSPVEAIETPLQQNPLPSRSSNHSVAPSIASSIATRQVSNVRSKNGISKERSVLSTWREHKEQNDIRRIEEQSSEESGHPFDEEEESSLATPSYYEDEASAFSSDLIRAQKKLMARRRAKNAVSKNLEEESKSQLSDLARQKHKDLHQYWSSLYNPQAHVSSSQLGYIASVEDFSTASSSLCASSFEVSEAKSWNSFYTAENQSTAGIQSTHQSCPTSPELLEANIARPNVYPDHDSKLERQPSERRTRFTFDEREPTKPVVQLSQAQNSKDEARMPRMLSVIQSMSEEDEERLTTKQDKGSNTQRRLKILLLLICLLVAAGAGVGCYLGLRPSRGNREKSSSSPNNLPDEESSNLNDVCDRAQVIKEGSTILGTIDESLRLTDDIPDCNNISQEGSSSGYGRWYKFTPDKRIRITASTCEEEGTATTDVQVIVLEGGPSCKSDLLKCVGASDELCGGGGAVSWDAFAGTEYYILVRGYPNLGVFKLSLTQAVDNRVCDDAVTLSASSSASILGSTRRTKDDASSFVSSFEVCNHVGDFVDQQVQAWYTVETTTTTTSGGSSRAVCATLSSNNEAALGLALYQGKDCPDLVCAEQVVSSGDANSLLWHIASSSDADHNQQYFVGVTQDHGSASGQDFMVEMQELPSNMFCEHATAIFLDEDSLEHSFPLVVPSPDCAPKEQIVAFEEDVPRGGVWHRFVGTRELLTLSWNSSRSFLYALADGESCQDLQPIEPVHETDQSVTFWSEPDETYFIYTYDDSQDETDRTTTLQLQKWPDSSSMNCEDEDESISMTVEIGTMVWGTFGTATSSCNDTSRSYQVVGTGATLVASSCHHHSHSSMTASTTLSIDCSGCSSPTLKTQVIPCDDLGGQMVFWKSEQNAVYTVKVKNTHQNDAGIFALTIQEQDWIIPNDLCYTAQSLYQQLPLSVFGATVDAHPEPELLQVTEGCGLATTPTSRGVWYTLVGTGRSMTAHTCSGYTNFDTQLLVFGGASCGGLECVAADEDSCGSSSSVTFLSQPGVSYWILVQGFGTAAGDFELMIL